MYFLFFFLEIPFCGYNIYIYIIMYFYFLFLFEQIVTHSLQCTHYVILWNLAKSSEGTSRKVGHPL